MKKLLMVALGICIVASAAYADQTYVFSWEDGVSTIIGSYGNVVDPANVTGPQTGQAGMPGTSYTCPGAFDGDRYLHVAEEDHYGTPQAYLACVTGLQDGDIVTAGFWGYDDTPGASPSWRIWAHYSDAATCQDCPGVYKGSAGGNDAYTAGTGWDEVVWSWTYGIDGPPYDGYSALEIEGRIYSTPATCDSCRTAFWADYVWVTVPDYAHVQFPDMGPSATEATNWSAVKALYR